MALLPKHVIFREQGIQHALTKAFKAYAEGTNPVVIKGGKSIQFCQDVEFMLRQNLPIETVTGNVNKITVKFKVPQKV